MGTVWEELLELQRRRRRWEEARRRADMTATVPTGGTPLLLEDLWVLADGEPTLGATFPGLVQHNEQRKTDSTPYRETRVAARAVRRRRRREEKRRCGRRNSSRRRKR